MPLRLHGPAQAFLLVVSLAVLAASAASAQQTETRFDYRKGASGVLLLGAGWTPPGEAIGIWTSGPRSEINIKIKPETRTAEIALDLTAYIVKQRTWQEVSVLVGARTIGRFRFDTKAFEGVVTVPITRADVVGGEARILLLSTNPMSPAALGVDPRDHRPIAIALRELTVKERK